MTRSVLPLRWLVGRSVFVCHEAESYTSKHLSEQLMILMTSSVCLRNVYRSMYIHMHYILYVHIMSLSVPDLMVNGYYEPPHC